MKYGMSKEMLEAANMKVLKNRSYMENHGITVDDEFIPFAEFTRNTYMNAYRYVAELNHRVQSLNEYASNNGLVNIFFTLTLPSEYHQYKTSDDGRLVKNYKFEGFTPKEGSKELSRMLKRLFNDRGYRSIPRDKRVYFRVTEPHKDGTPHLHVSMYVPFEYADILVSVLNRLFPSPMGKVVTDVKNPVAYLMKYILKTLDDLRESDTDLTELTYWYIYHGIPRFFTSRTLIDLETYRALKGSYSLLELTDMYVSGLISVYVDVHKKKIVTIEIDGCDVLFKRFVRDTDNVHYDPVPSVWTDKDSHEYREVEVNGEKMHFFRNQWFGPFVNTSRSCKEMNDFELYNYVNLNSMETVEPSLYAIAYSEAIERGLMYGATYTSFEAQMFANEKISPDLWNEAKRVF